MIKKKFYEKPEAINLTNNGVVYGQDSTMGQCQDGSAPEGSTLGCNTGNSVVDANCAFGTFPTSSECNTGSSVGYANQCANGDSLG